MHDHVPEGCYRHVESQHRKASTPSDELTTLKRVHRDLAAFSVMCYKGGGQRPAGDGRNAEGNQPLTGDGVGTGPGSSDGHEESPNGYLPNEPTFY